MEKMQQKTNKWDNTGSNDCSKTKQGAGIDMAGLAGQSRKRLLLRCSRSCHLNTRSQPWKDLRKEHPGKGISIGKGPKALMNFVCLRSRDKTIMAEQEESGRAKTT